MGRFRTSWDLFKRSLSVIGKNKALLLFPGISLASIILIVLFFISPFVLSDTGHALTDPLHWDVLGKQLGNSLENKDIMSGAKAFGWWVLLYLVTMFSTTFFNVAFYHEIIHALNGNKVSISRGFKAALSKIKLITIWSLFAGIVGIIIRNLEERLGFVGRWVMALIGIAWSVACIFVIPVMIREEKSSNPLKLLKASALMLKKTWGETVIGFVGIGGLFLVGFLVSLPLFIIALAFVLSATLETWAIALMFLLYLISMVALAYLVGVTRHIYQCALYLYASEGVVPGPFDEEMMNRAWKVKKARKG
jgi:hypothetical protein